MVVIVIKCLASISLRSAWRILVVPGCGLGAGFWMVGCCGPVPDGLRRPRPKSILLLALMFAALLSSYADRDMEFTENQKWKCYKKGSDFRHFVETRYMMHGSRPG